MQMMTVKKISISIIARRISLFLILVFTLFTTETNLFGFSGSSESVFRIVFYNVENLFDTENNPGKDDDAFTPDGDRRWNWYRLKKKVNNLYKAIVAAGEWETPAIIGLCEVENRHVLEMLAYETGLKKSEYSIIHRNSADRRGIDVAVLYRSVDFMLLDTKFIEINFPFDTTNGTRDIVYLKGVCPPGDTLHVFVNHWPSRWGGQAQSQPRRNYAASVLRSHTDSIFRTSRLANIIVMGDFNDEPEDESLKKILGAGLDYINPGAGQLYNISHKNYSNRHGSYKYQGEWYLFDQFIVSGTLLNGAAGVQTSLKDVKVFSAGFLMLPDESWFGHKPFRTYEGFRHTGGFSDHFPVVLDLLY